MTQVVNGRQKQWVSADFTSVPNPIAGEGRAANEVIVLSQLTDGLDAEEQARQAAITALEQVLSAEQTARINGDQLSEQRLRQAIEGVAKITVAARTETLPVNEAVPGVLDGAASDDWHGWFLVDAGTGNEDTGIYRFLPNGTTQRVTEVAMQTGLLVFVNGGTFENTQWLMIDDPVEGIADFVPWQRVSEFDATAPLYKEGNIVRLAWDAGFLAISGAGELTIKSDFINRVSSLENNLDSVTARVAAVEDTALIQEDILDSSGKLLAQRIPDQVVRWESNNVAGGFPLLDTDRRIYDENLPQWLLDGWELFQTATQTAAQTAATLATNNPIKVLDSAFSGITRQVETLSRGGVEFAKTTYTVQLGAADFARTRFSESATPYQKVDPPEESYPGTSYVVSFTDSSPVPDGSIEVWFHKGYRATSSPSPSPSPSPTPSPTPTGSLIDPSNFILNASTINPSSSLKNIFDNNPNTNWTTGEWQYDGLWVSFDMRQENSISKIEIECQPNDYARTVTMSGSHNGVAWTELKTVTGSDLTIIEFPQPVTYRFVELRSRQSFENKWWVIREVRVFG